MPRRIADVAALAQLVAARAAAAGRPFVVAIDGRSGVGKSTLAASLAQRLAAVVIEGDDFYAGGTNLRDDDAIARAEACIDWRRQRSVLEALLQGREAVWRAFDWDAFDGRLNDVASVRSPRSVVILEGVYSGRPQLRDLIDLAVLVTAPDDQRTARLVDREGGIGPWERQWHEAEIHYFATVAPSAAFDLQIGGECG